MMEEEDKIVQKTSRIRLIKDKMAGSMMLTFTLVSVLLVVLIGIGLVLKSLPILHDKSLWELLSGAKWKPMRGDFGFLPFIMGTLWVTAIAILWTLPVSGSRYFGRSAFGRLWSVGYFSRSPLDFRSVGSTLCGIFYRLFHTGCRYCIGDHDPAFADQFVCGIIFFCS